MKTVNYRADELFQIYTRTKEFILEDYESQTSFDHVNPFWSHILSKRTNFPSFSETLSFLANNSAYGLGKRMEENVELEKESFHDAYLSIQGDHLKVLRNRVKESVIGFPKYFEEDSKVGSTSFTENIVSTSRLVEAVEKHLQHKDKINVLEIGAGWGAVMSQLVQYFGDRINKVAICDLHENLFISSFHLQSVFLDRNVGFVRGNEPFKGEDFSLNFASPSGIEHLEIEFDLVFNMISFQEMNLDVVENYMQYIQNHLAKDGIFYSENGVQVKNTYGQATKFSEYKYPEYFDIMELRNGARFCPHLFFGNKHEAIMCHKNKEQERVIDPNHLDALSLLMHLRLDANIDDLRSRVISGKPTEADTDFLGLVHDFFSTSDRATKKNVLGKIQQTDFKTVYDYIQGLFCVSQKQFGKALSLFRSVEPELEGLVKINVMCYMGVLDKSVQADVIKRISELSPEMVNTAKGVFKHASKSKRNMVDKITKQLHMDVKRIMGYSLYQLSYAPSIMKERLLKKIENKVVKMRHKNAIPYHLK